MLELMSDLRFHMPSVAMQKGWGERVDRYVWGVVSSSSLLDLLSYMLKFAILKQVLRQIMENKY